MDGDVAAQQGIGINVDAGTGNEVTSGIKARFDVPYSGIITAWSVTSNTMGNVEFDVWKVNGAIPTVSDSIVGDTSPSLNGQQYMQSTDLTNWTTTITAGDVFTFNVVSSSGLQQVSINLWVTKD